MTALEIWTVYDHPLDYPGYFVARKWFVGLTLEPTDEILLDTDLNSLRKHMPPWLYCMPAQKDDDPKIIEVWL
jgi:hypothetical protein